MTNLLADTKNTCRICGKKVVVTTWRYCLNCDELYPSSVARKKVIKSRKQ